VASYPALALNPIIEREALAWAALQVGMGDLVAQVRELHDVPIRVVPLAHLGLTQTDFNTMQNFWLSRKGRIERFDFTHPSEGTTFKAKFRDRGFRWIHRQTDTGPRYDVFVVIEETP
jgi:hypothetical protein